MKTEEKKVAVVTGGASGIGLATAIGLEKDGYKVIVADINKVSWSFRSDVDILSRRCDVSRYDQVVKLFQFCKDHLGRLDVLVNVAGVHYSSKFVHEENPENFDKLTKVNVYGTYWCCHEALKLMIEGTIINIGSSVGIAADPAAAAYSASKAWVIHFTKCLAQQYGKQGIRCNTLCPGATDTPFLRNAFGNDPAKLKEIAEYNPRGMVATPEDIANTILFLVSDKSRFVNGATWTVDGGESIFYWEPPKG